MRKSLQTILTKMTTIQGQIEDTLENAEAAEHPNDDRIEKLQTELECLEGAIDNLESID